MNTIHCKYTKVDDKFAFCLVNVINSDIFKTRVSSIFEALSFEIKENKLEWIY